MMTSITMVVVMALMINHSFQTGLQGYLNRAERARVDKILVKVEQHYQRYHDWNRMAHQPEIWANIMVSLGEPPPRRDPHMPVREPLPAQGPVIPLGERIHLLDAKQQRLLGPPEMLIKPDAGMHIEMIPIEVEGELVGWIRLSQSQQINGDLAESFFNEQLSNFLWIAVCAALFSFVIATLLVRHFLRPLGYLNAGAQAWSQGDYHFQVESQGRDELAELATTFNRLADTLKDQRRLRRQWLTDIAHELRTPIAVLQSEIEAMLDGIREIDFRYIESLHAQTLNLTKLVEDLHQLSVSDEELPIEPYETVYLETLVEQSVMTSTARFTQRNLRLICQSDTQKRYCIFGNIKSLQQLIGNLLENSYRYTDEGGNVLIRLESSEKSIRLIVEDSAPGVPEVSLPRLFERLYRVDESRSRAHGGSGLGLAICRKIVIAHQGDIRATQSRLGGLKIEINLPAKEC
jgi:two-component system sensor histidine kinase BaeS